MVYSQRLSMVFICERYKNDEFVLRAQWGSPHYRVGPFVSFRGINKLTDKLSAEDRRLFFKLTGLDLIKKDGFIDKSIFFTNEVYEVINSPNLFVQIKRHGSIKSASKKDRDDLLRLIMKKDNIYSKIGGVKYGQLELCDSSSLKISWVYSGADVAIPQFDKCVEGRDIDKEYFFMQELSKCLDVPVSDICNGVVYGFDISNLEKVNGENWVVLLNGKPVKVGVLEVSDWFHDAGGKNQADIDIDAIVSAYLAGRKYIEVGSSLRVVQPINKLTSREALFAVSAGVDIPVDNIFSIKKEFASDKHDLLLDRLSSYGFNGVLKPYQCDGVLWLGQLRKYNFGGILADEMGLGKTVQILAYIAFAGIRQTLLVCPASLIHNWMSEINKFLGDRLCVNTKIDSECERDKQSILIVSYQTLMRNHEKIASKYDLLVLDEGQVVKNRNTKTAESLRYISSDMRIVVTGTPIENSVHDLWSHLTFIAPFLDGLYKRIIRRFPGFYRSGIAAEFSAKAFQGLILRRTKRDVDLGLPELTEVILYCEMGHDQRFVYNNISALFKRLLSGGAAARINSIALEGILRLRQACSLPSALPKSINPGGVSESVKIDRLMNIIDREESKIIVFSQFKKVLDNIQVRLDGSGIGYSRLDGDTVDRKTPVLEFQNNSSVRIFLIGFKAGGVGLNLTAAEQVILFDPWWNPAAESQAFARAHRIGQDKPVKVIKLICKDTIEEKMLVLLKSKKELANILDLEGGFSAQELVSLLS